MHRHAAAAFRLPPAVTFRQDRDVDVLEPRVDVVEKCATAADRRRKDLCDQDELPHGAGRLYRAMGLVLEVALRADFYRSPVRHALIFRARLGC
jgi:hypothetical protein